MSQWVALRPIFKVCASDMGYEREGRRSDAWWLQEALETQLRVIMEEILWEFMKRQQGERNMSYFT